MEKVEMIKAEIERRKAEKKHRLKVLEYEYSALIVEQVYESILAFIDAINRNDD